MELIQNNERTTDYKCNQCVYFAYDGITMVGLYSGNPDAGAFCLIDRLEKVPYLPFVYYSNWACKRFELRVGEPEYLTRRKSQCKKALAHFSEKQAKEGVTTS